MATRTATRSEQPSGVLYTWTGILNGDDGNYIEATEYGDRTFQIIGTFGVGGSVTMQGSNDGTNAFTLTDPQGNAVTKTAAAGETLMETPRYIRPLCTAGDGSTSLTVMVWARRSVR